MVPVAGVEPARYRYHWILSPARLPIPSHRPVNMYYSRQVKEIQVFFAIIATFYLRATVRKSTNRDPAAHIPSTGVRLHIYSASANNLCENYLHFLFQTY